jgi:hypothetical protein
MQQFDIANPSRMRGTGPTQAVQEFVRHWLTGRRGLIIGGIVVVAAGLALGWNWLTEIGVAPVILSLAPCAAMCAVGACAMMRGNASCAKPGSLDQSKSLEPTATPTSSNTLEP